MRRNSTDGVDPELTFTSVSYVAVRLPAALARESHAPCRCRRGAALLTGLDADDAIIVVDRNGADMVVVVLLHRTRIVVRGDVD